MSSFLQSCRHCRSNHYCKHFTTWRQCLACMYAQNTCKVPLQETCNGLLTNQSRLYHLVMKPVARSTLSDAMNRLALSVFGEPFNELLARYEKLVPKHGFRFKKHSSQLIARLSQFETCRVNWSFSWSFLLENYYRTAIICDTTCTILL